MFVFARAVTWAALFIGFVLIYSPGRLLSWTGIVRPAAIARPQIVGMVIGAVGAAVALWCIFTFATIGRGTPAPFDPPAGDSGPLPFRAESDVHRRRTRPRQRRAVLRVVAASRLCRPLLSRNARFRGGLRGAHSAANLRARVRSILPPSQAMVAEGMNRA